ncbi:hypothetical protein QBC34DRAFT_302599 [Podospora aff. communis PSN243]|uniref:Uncharacterized protein n=1 Tax=Podospora aff. communis PSN243 TaxID=3040156 RepID=A0AAV9GHV7_9PEZI|nr:hypothetical protein QBC34DRAFT_302599 [Podospora aff. communis PSN243]
MEDANGVKAGSSSGSSTNSGPPPIIPECDRINLNALPYPLGVDSAVLIPPARTGYGKANVDEIEVRQHEEDIKAYQYDLNWLRAKLDRDDLTPQETRTYQLRILDVSHQIRHCQHRIETLQATMRGKPLRGAHGAISSSNANPISSSKRPLGLDAANDVEEVQTNGTASVKRPKIQLDQSSDHDHDTSVMPEGEGDSGRILQRLGEWTCTLCLSAKYLTAPPPRTPSMPCKWKLKDISKMINHFTEMHVEHSVEERCKELGQALSQNRGPFEYWLRKTKSQNVGDGSIMDDVVEELMEGSMPAFLRRLSRAAARMPSE